MTMYSAVGITDTVIGNNVSYPQSMALQNASLYPIRIHRVDFTWVSQVTSFIYVRLTRYEGSTMSGGLAVSPFPLRQGANPTGVLCRSRYMIYSSSSGNYTQSSPVNLTGSPKVISNVLGSASASEGSTWEPPSELLVLPGSAFYIASAYANSDGVTTYFSNLITYFEEVQEDWTS